MIHKNNDPAQGYFVVNTTNGCLVFHEPSQKIKAHEREATAEDIAAASMDALIKCGHTPAPPVEDRGPQIDLSALVKATGTGTVT